MVGEKLKREIVCPKCATTNQADDEFCVKCGANLFDLLGCEQCKNKNGDHLKNQKGRCFDFDQANKEQILGHGSRDDT